MAPNIKHDIQQNDIRSELQSEMWRRAEWQYVANIKQQQKYIQQNDIQSEWQSSKWHRGQWQNA
jgi:hypothetical protein